MSDLGVLDRTFHFILKRMVQTGQAPHYTEIASELGVPMEEGRKILRELFAAGVPGWLFPGTDYITSLLPSIIFPLSTGSPSTGSRSGSASEGLNRWRSAGYFPGKRCRSRRPVWIAVCPCG